MKKTDNNKTDTKKTSSSSNKNDSTSDSNNPNSKNEKENLKKHIEHLEGELEKREIRLEIMEQILDGIPGSVYWKDSNGRYLGRNTHALNKCIETGIEKKDSTKSHVIGLTDYDLMKSDIADNYRENDLKVMAQNRMIQCEEPYINTSGTEIVQLSAKSPLKDSNGGTIGLIGITMDISKLKLVQKKLEAAAREADACSHAKTKFIRNMEHDLRTPLTGIIGLANLLPYAESPEEVKEFSEDIRNASTQLLSHCDNILVYLRISSETIPTTKKPTTCRKLSEITCDLYKPLLKKKPIHFFIPYDDNEDIEFKCDPYRIQCILMNLMSNSAKFTHKGSITLTVHARIADNPTLHIKIEDTGIGIPEDKFEHIFERFARLTDSNQGIYSGYGLGLSIVKQFVRECGGEMDLSSTVGKGSCFEINIPIELVENQVIENGVIGNCVTGNETIEKNITENIS